MSHLFRGEAPLLGQALADFTHGDWTFIAEGGRGFTDLSTAYVLVSRLFGSSRASVRAEAFNGGRVLTAAYLVSVRKARLGAEARSDGRVAVEVRWYF